MKNINGFNYSRDPFDDYKLRIKIQIIDTDHNEHLIDTYTDNEDEDTISDAIDESVTNKVLTWEIVHKATKEQDEKTTELVNQWLKDI